MKGKSKHVGAFSEPEDGASPAARHVEGSPGVSTLRNEVEKTSY